MKTGKAKKIISLLLASAMVFILTACGSVQVSYYNKIDETDLGENVYMLLDTNIDTHHSSSGLCVFKLVHTIELTKPDDLVLIMGGYTPEISLSGNESFWLTDEQSNTYPCTWSLTNSTYYKSASGMLYNDCMAADIEISYSGLAAGTYTINWNNLYFTYTSPADGTAVTIDEPHIAASDDSELQSQPGVSRVLSFTVCDDIVFDVQGHGTAPASQAINSDNPESEALKYAYRPVDPVCDGYSFGGWFLTSDCDGEEFDFSSPVDPFLLPLTLYAKWTADETPAPDPTPEPYSEPEYVSPVIISPVQKEEKKDNNVITEKTKDQLEIIEDVPKDNWARQSVNYVLENRIMDASSVSASALCFSPETGATRGEICQALYVIAGCPDVTGSSVFADLPGSYAYKTAVTWAEENGIIFGYGNGLVGAENTVTREQLASLLMRFAAYQGKDTSGRNSLKSFKDYKKISSYALAGLEWANKEGLFVGTTENLMMPQNLATRAQVSAILMRYASK